MTDIASFDLTPSLHAHMPAGDACVPFEALSDDDLEAVVGGLARVWNVIAARPVTAPAAVTTSSLSAETAQRMSA